MNEGLKVKYNVFKVSDGSIVNDCFVLRPDKDPAALHAIQAYAAATENKVLAVDLLEWAAEIRRNETPEEQEKLEKELGECANCGGKGRIISDFGGFRVACVECFASTGLAITMQEAKERWNRRTDGELTEALAAELEIIAGCPFDYYTKRFYQGHADPNLPDWYFHICPADKYKCGKGEEIVCACWKRLAAEMDGK